MPRTRARTKAGKQRFVGKEMHRFKVGSLKSGSGHKVRSRKQAIAIALSQAGLSRRRRK
jgi:hypothetical protein